jgi:hypothetical protein
LRIALFIAILDAEPVCSSIGPHCYNDSPFLPFLPATSKSIV